MNKSERQEAAKNRTMVMLDPDDDGRYPIYGGFVDEGTVFMPNDTEYRPLHITVQNEHEFKIVPGGQEAPAATLARKDRPPD